MSLATMNNYKLLLSLIRRFLLSLTRNKCLLEFKIIKEILDRNNTSEKIIKGMIGCILCAYKGGT